MGSTTPNYGLATDVAVDDFVEPVHQNRVADTLDKVLGSFLSELMPAGAMNGWNLTGDQTVSAGEGLVGACWCRTTAEQTISELSTDAVNYVYATVTAESPTDGAVNFVAQLAPPGPGGSVFLGTIELDGSGQVISVDSDADGAQRHCHPLTFGALSGQGEVQGIEADETVIAEVDHSSEGSFRIPGDLVVASESADFEWLVVEACSGSGFSLEVTNTGSSTADFTYTWQREGILR